MHAGINLRKHTWRALLRVCALLASDLAAFALLRASMRAVHDWPVFQSGHLDFIRWLFAGGYLGGWQYAVALVLSLVVRGTYGPGDNRRDASRILSACVLATALPLWASLWTEPFLLTTGRYVLTVVPAFLTLLAGRLLLDHLVVRYAPSPHAVARAVLVGHAGECIEMRGRRALTEAGGFNVLGYVDVQPTPDRGALGSIIDLERILLEHRADTLVLCGPVDDNTIVRVMRAGMTAECQVLTAARRYELAGVAPSVVWRRGQPFIQLRAVGLRWHQLMLKRIVDVTLSSAALVVLSPIMLLIAIAVRLESPGPAIFRQRRLTRHGQWFHCYKFRSMYPDAEARLKADPELYQLYLENDYKLPEPVDKRITRLGRILRSTSLDELPQFWNVLKGEMSLVGPRPIVPDEIRHYNGEGPLLLTLKPGITGAWQVSGRSNLQYPERAAVELEYVERWSLMSDLTILARTIPAVLARRGAH
jgi:exopolysaccharide biosynthesis polyprenyl glycosylphosphotransferase